MAGHIEAIGISTYHNGTPDADVSGTVMVRGTAHDNVRIDAITLSIDGGAPFQVAHWGVTGLVSDVPAAFQITDEDLTDAGHDIDWDYKWNTAGIATFAKNDVVPYITVSGYNLAPAVTGIGAGSSDVRIVNAANRDSLIKNAGAGSRGLVYAGVGSPYTSFTATISTNATDALYGSGYLVVWVNGVPSLNARSGRSNAETNFVSTTGTDERWLSVWARTVFKTDVPAAPYANHASYPSMRLNGTTPVFAYVNNVEGYGRAQYWNGAAEWEIYENWDLFTFTALDLNSNGNHAALYDINVVQNGAVNWPDDKGGIMTSFFYQPPDTGWSSTSYFYRDYNIWLDNLWKNGVSAILGRYQYPDIDMSRDGTTAFSRVFYSVYDAIDDRVLVRAFDVGTNSGSVGSANKVTDTATNLYTDIAQQNQGGTWPAYTDVATNNRRFGGGGTNAGISPPNAYVIDAAG
ncbi:MAG TPA: hypothetical protein VLH81_01090, partial [Desulfobacterales bacterium]|nr:hypothetical protein [Desulfobacterales bacterium]